MKRIFRSRFLWEIYAGYAVIIVATAVVVGVVLVRDAEHGVEKRIQSGLERDAILVRDISEPFVDAAPDSAFQQRIRALGRRTGTRYTVIAANGQVLADSREDPRVMDNHRDRPEIMAAANNGMGTSTRFSRTVSAPSMYVAIPVMKSGVLSGFVRTSTTLEAVNARRAAVRRGIAFSLVLPVLTALLLGLWLARNFTRPLVEMTDVALAVAAGEHGQRLRIDRTDEIGELADALNVMTARLKDQIETMAADRNKTLAILAGMVEGVVAVDSDERVVHANAAAQAILGIDARTALGRRIWEVMRVVEVSESLGESMRQNRMRVSEVRIPTAQKDQVIQLTATPLHNGSGEIDGAVVVLHDVSELRLLESVRRDFVANISHELKTPLTAIRGLVETLIDDREMDRETHDRFIEKIGDQSTRLTNLVSDLLTLSRLESGPGGLRFEAMDLRETVNESVRTQFHAAETKRVGLSSALSDAPVIIEGDAEAMRELVDNLVSNAIKYTPSGGRVDVRLSAENGSAVLEVIDTGIGIPPEEQSRVFERFYRVDKARSRQMGGTGLGLSIVKHVALSHGGSVSLKSASGRGSTFRVQLGLKPGNVNRREGTRQA
ncbi:MAG TPA: ATP-binding protein [Candidatus Krumholzibacteria bacterium]|nr:ATP-binding protein [Candidatus Krumholzibacteria bacterium]